MVNLNLFCLQPDFPYKIQKITIQDTSKLKFSQGTNFVLTLLDSENGNVFDCMLPNRFAADMGTFDVTEYNNCSDDEKCSITFKGYDGKAYDIEFK